METETLSKLYLELANVVPAGTKTARQIATEHSIKLALLHLDHAPTERRNGPIYQAVNELRKALGLPPVEIRGRFSDGVQ